MLAIEPTDDYLGIEQMKHMKAANGDAVLSEHSDLSHNEEFVFRDEITPYTKQAVKMLYDDALSNGDQKKGILVLDCTNPRVTAVGNVKEKAKLVRTCTTPKEKASLLSFTWEKAYRVDALEEAHGKHSIQKCCWVRSLKRSTTNLALRRQCSSSAFRKCGAASLSAQTDAFRPILP
jgi:hypothetical protein